MMSDVLSALSPFNIHQGKGHIMRDKAANIGVLMWHGLARNSKGQPHMSWRQRTAKGLVHDDERGLFRFACVSCWTLRGMSTVQEGMSAT